ncbi:NLR family CARD domain-containing protein 3 [Chanos chanos]|uniref:NLR family CARD domain-containing protein 3 n=1 Tax=Chanos chanos TaxID=29144 RepID=A0A6J2V134_CHACN|nr:NLR family CARD domain-containing protein 3-like [Chanos chanos]
MASLRSTEPIKHTLEHRPTLVEVTGDMEQRLCQKHHRALEVFCKTDQTDICKVCAVEEHKGHSKLYREISSVPDAQRLLTMTLGTVKTKCFQNFKRYLNEDYPGSLGDQPEDLDESGIAEKMVESFEGEGALRITFSFLNGGISFKKAMEANKANLIRRFQHISEGISPQGKLTVLKDIYTELYITEGGSGEIINEHEVREIEITSKRQTIRETPISCNELFNILPGQRKQIRTVLTKGVAGIGKTVFVQKFILDWAEGKANKDIMVIVPLPFRDLNLKKENYSLIQLLYDYAPELKEIKDIEDEKLKLLLILDSLDEYRFPLDFHNSELCSDVTKSTSVHTLLTNLIKGNLLPSALLWITSRPAAANQIPPEFVHKVTEIRGFNDLQKEEYFRKRIIDQSLANRIITHIKSSRSLYIMCHIPVFCWLSASVLEKMMSVKETGEIPKTLTEMYTHFLLIQTSLKNKKYHGATGENPKKLSESDKAMILKLGELAFQQLEKGNLIFYEEDLRKFGTDVSKASEYSSVCTEIFREELGLYREKVFCFLHLSIQEHLAAVYAHVSCVDSNMNVFIKDYKKRKKSSLSDLHQTAVDKALQSKNGHLDLFLRFLLGLSLGSNQSLLQDLMRGDSPLMKKYSTTESTEYIKMKIKEESCPERIINLLHCLNELNDNSLVEEIQTAFRSGALSAQKLEPHQCSALAYLLLMSEEVLDEFDLTKYKTSAAGRLRLLPVLRTCRRARLVGCSLSSESSWGSVAFALQSEKSPLKDLDLGYNNLTDSGVKLLCDALISPNCKLQKIRLASCNLLSESYEQLALTLQSVNSSLTHLDLNYNNIRDSGAKSLCNGLMSPNCKLQSLRLSMCGLTEVHCVDLASVLKFSNLRELELKDNDLQDSGVKQLSLGLRDPVCKLEKLGLSGCLISEEGCASLASALRSNPSHLRELDLTYSHLGDSGEKMLSVLLKDSQCKLEKLRVDHGGECRAKPGPRKYACQLTLDENTAHRNLSLSEDKKRVSWTAEEQPYPDHPDRFKKYLQVLCKEALTDRCYWEVEWSGEIDIGVAYRCTEKDFSISSNGRMNEREGFTRMHKSFSLACQKDVFNFWHNGEKSAELFPPHPSTKVGVYLDCETGTLSFYSIFSDTLTHLYTFHSTFTEPLYVGLQLYHGSAITLCQPE